MNRNKQVWLLPEPLGQLVPVKDRRVQRHNRTGDGGGSAETRVAARMPDPKGASIEIAAARGLKITDRDDYRAAQTAYAFR